MSSNTSATGRGPRREGAKEKFWRHTLRSFAVSGQSVRQFCRARQLSEPSFYAWRRTLAGRDAQGRRTTRPAAPAFLPIRLAGASDASGDMPFEIVLAGGYRIRLRPPVDRAALLEIVRALQLAHLTPEPAEASPSATEA